jgi:hypothetical protein
VSAYIFAAALIRFRLSVLSALSVLFALSLFLVFLALLIQAGMGIPRRAWREKCS